MIIFVLLVVNTVTTGFGYALVFGEVNGILRRTVVVDLDHSRKAECEVPCISRTVKSRPDNFGYRRPREQMCG